MMCGGHHGGRRGGHHGGYGSYPDESGRQAGPALSLVCAACGTAHAVGAQFCHQCGVSLAAAKCGGCGTQLAPDAKFCPHAARRGVDATGTAGFYCGDSSRDLSRDRHLMGERWPAGRSCLWADRTVASERDSLVCDALPLPRSRITASRGHRSSACVCVLFAMTYATVAVRGGDQLMENTALRCFVSDIAPASQLGELSLERAQ